MILRIQRDFFLLLFALWLCATVSALPCSYKAPRAEDVMLGVPIGRGESEYDDETYSSSARVRRATSEFQQLRIYIHYDNSIFLLSQQKQDYIKKKLLPEAVSYWEKVLKVKRVSIDPIRLRRKCSTNYHFFRKDTQTIACDTSCRSVSTCGDAVIPDDHLLDCSYCFTSDNCYNSGTIGKGVADHDFILYVTALNTTRCVSKDSVAYAAHCQLEEVMDRPIAGHVNLCPFAISTHHYDQEAALSTMKHELVHALGFSVGLFAFFRDENGDPRTRRSYNGRPVNFDKNFGIFLWDSNTVRTVHRHNWKAGNNVMHHSVQMVVTPKVKEEVRKHFDCSDLEGAELENQGGEGTALTHWEKRLFENEAMTGTHTQNPVYSRITLALLEDSGWYKPNYEMAEELHWGKDLGCEFVKISCGDWIERRLRDGEAPYPFCNDPKYDGKRSLSVTRCSAQRDALSLCNLIPYESPVPKQYRYFNHLKNVADSRAHLFGGAVELADFCPFRQEFEWRMINSSIRRDSRCELEDNDRLGEDVLEIYGNSSRCFDFLLPWTEKKCGQVRRLNHYMAGCYKHSCANNRLNIGVHDSPEYPCHFDGQLVHIRKITGGWLREGMIVCPPCSEFCDNCTLSEPNMDYIGDPPLNIPCSSCWISVIRPLAVILTVKLLLVFPL